MFLAVTSMAFHEVWRRQVSLKFLCYDILSTVACLLRYGGVVWVCCCGCCSS